jgi:hypothetical protein
LLSTLSAALPIGLEGVRAGDEQAVDPILGGGDLAIRCGDLLRDRFDGPLLHARVAPHAEDVGHGFGGRPVGRLQAVRVYSVVWLRIASICIVKNPCAQIRAWPCLAVVITAENSAEVAVVRTGLETPCRV